MFDSGVFSPFLGLCANAQALNFHTMLSSPGVRGGWCPSSLQSLWGLLGCALLLPGWLGPGCPSRGEGWGGDQCSALDLCPPPSQPHLASGGRRWDCVYLPHHSHSVPAPHLFLPLQPGQPPIPGRDEAFASTFPGAQGRTPPTPRLSLL